MVLLHGSTTFVEDAAAIAVTMTAAATPVTVTSADLDMAADSDSVATYSYCCCCQCCRSCWYNGGSLLTELHGRNVEPLKQKQLKQLAFSLEKQFDFIVMESTVVT